MKGAEKEITSLKQTVQAKNLVVGQKDQRIAELEDTGKQYRLPRPKSSFKR
jgi:hypothetical protein